MGASALLDADSIPWLPALQRLLAGIASGRGETLPPMPSRTLKRRTLDVSRRET